MADRPDSTGTTTASDPAGDNGRGGGEPSDSGSDVVPRSELDAERKRRAGQERAHQREMGKVQKQISDLAAFVQNRQPGDANVAVPSDILKDLDLSDPKDKLLHDLYVNQSQWSQQMRKEVEERQRGQQNRQLVEEAVEEVEEAIPGVPRNVLDLSTPETVRASAEKWQADERIRKLEVELAEVKAGRVSATDAAAAARLAERQRLGATQVPTSTGSAPPLPSAVQQEIDRIDAEIALAKRQHKGSEVIRLGREKALTIQEAETAAVR